MNNTLATTKQKIIWFMAIFYILVIARVLWYIAIDAILSEPLGFFSSNLNRAMIWILPPVLYLRYVDKVPPTRYLKLTTSLKEGLIWSVGVAIFGIVWQLGALLFKLDTIGKPDLLDLLSLVTVPVCEEIMMRGFILGKLSELISFRKALILTSLFFYSVHFPGWIMISHLSPWLMVRYAVSVVFIVGMGGAWLTRKSNSLYPAMILHAVNNFIAGI